MTAPTDKDKAIEESDISLSAEAIEELEKEQAAEQGDPSEQSAGRDAASYEQQIADLESELEAMRDQLLRASAELENQRRRSQIDVSNARKYGIEGFANELLSVRDSLDLASSMKVDEDPAVVEKMLEGLQLTLKQFDSVFDKFNIERIAPQKGDRFDPDVHQAMSLQPSDEVEPDHIVMVMQTGYRLHDRLLRPAMVTVAKPLEGS